MRRREFIGLVGGVAASWPTTMRAQQLKRVVLTWVGRPGVNQPEVAGFRQGLKDAGYVDGQNVLIKYLYAEGRSERVAEIVAEALQMQPDVICVLGAPLVAALKQATSTIPIVMATGDPVGAGYVASLPRPGGNITGISLMQGVQGLTAKRMELIKDALPNASRVGFLHNPDIPSALSGLADARRVADALGFAIRPVVVRRMDEMEETFASLAHNGMDAMQVETNPPFVAFPDAVGGLLLRHRIAGVSEQRTLAEGGGLMSYGPNIFDAMRRLGYFVERILTGANPANLPVEQATKLELVINMKTARTLGLAIPATLIARADDVIE
jgi:putative ABC transport system substrate-binding protein